MGRERNYLEIGLKQVNLELCTYAKLQVASMLIFVSRVSEPALSKTERKAEQRGELALIAPGWICRCNHY